MRSSDIAGKADNGDLMRGLYGRLWDEFSLDKHHVDDFLLPTWWSREPVNSEEELLEAQTHIAKAIGIRPSLVIDEDSRLSDGLPPHAFRSGDDAAMPCRIVLIAAARTLAGAYPVERGAERVSAQDARAWILERNESITLAGAVDFAWEHGIPIVHVKDKTMPRANRKPYGALVKRGQTVAAAVSHKQTRAAWNLFNVVHEIGHAMRGHIDGSGLVVENESPQSASGDHETEANDYAYEVLTGVSAPQISVAGFEYQAILDASLLYGRGFKVDPAWIAITLGYHAHKDQRQDIWAFVGNIVKKVSPSEESHSIINDRLYQRIAARSDSIDAAQQMRRFTSD